MFNINIIRNLFANGDNKTVLINIINAFLVKGGAIIVSFLTLPAYMNYFQEEQVLGFWFTILSVLTWIFVFDLGIGNGLRNNLVKPLVEKDFKNIKKYISSAYISIGILVMIIYIVFFLLYRFINWHVFFNISETLISVEVLNETLLIIFSAIMLQFFLRLVNSIIFAMQKSALNNLLGLISNILIFLYVSIFTYDDLSVSLINLAIAYFISINLPLIILTVIIFTTTLRKSKPHVKYFRKKHAGKVLKLGSMFFVIQILYMLLTTTNEILISWLSGPEMVVEYQVYNRIFALLGTVYTLMLTPIWSMVTKAFSENNFLWIKKLYNIFLIFAVIIILVQFLLIPFAQILINLWLGDNSIEVNYFYAAMFAILASMITWIGANNSIANGFGELRTQMIFFTIGILLKFPLAWYLVNELNSWIGVVIASIISLLLYCIVQPIWLRYYLNKKIKENSLHKG